MGDEPSSSWVSKRSHLKVSETEVLPVLFKSRKLCTSSAQEVKPVPLSFPETDVELSDALPCLKEWLLEHIERLHRVGTMNSKPGALETPQVLQDGRHRFTVWFEPTAATFAVLTPNKIFSDNVKKEVDGKEEETGGKDDFNSLSPTSQTLHVIGERYGGGPLGDGT